MDSLTVARSLRGSIGMLAMAWLINDRTTERAVELGLDAEGRGGYAVGRLGVLGHCPVDAVVSAAYFWEPRLMRQMVTAGRAAATRSSRIRFTISSLKAGWFRKEAR